MKTLRSEYGYLLGELPQFRTRAYNIRGWSQYSELNIEGGLIQTEPS